MRDKKDELKGVILMSTQTFQAASGTVEKPVSLQISEFRRNNNVSDEQVVDLKFEFKCNNGQVVETATMTYQQ